MSRQSCSSCTTDNDLRSDVIASALARCASTHTKHVLAAVSNSAIAIRVCIPGKTAGITPPPPRHEAPLLECVIENFPYSISPVVVWGLRRFAESFVTKPGLLNAALTSDTFSTASLHEDVAKELEEERAEFKAFHSPSSAVDWGRTALDGLA